jgi:diaminohydroxyphosphoribosylaminopyrimidine deaminase/5-amino-6-(5-phosphoribosylamino)uracil reductase
VVALTAAGAAARGGTAIVTLEPCDHTGRTGPCTRALLTAGVARVVVALRDPDPVAAGGLDTLHAAGVSVTAGILADDARDVLIGWLTAVRLGRPYTTWKFAATLDGRSAAPDGASQWITSAEARADVHRLRATVDAVMPDGALASSAPDGARHQPLRVVVDSAGRTPSGSRVRDSAAATWIATSAEVGSTPDGRVDLTRLGACLYQRGVRTALLEGGPTLAGEFLRAGLIDRVVAYVAPILFGGGLAALGDAGVTTLGGAIALDLLDVTQIGPDLRLTATVRKD